MLRIMNWDSWIALAALVLALSGLLLQWLRGRTRLRIEVKQGIPVYGSGLGDLQLQVDVKIAGPTRLKSAVSHSGFQMVKAQCS